MTVVDRFTTRDRAFMQRALELARRGLGWVEPNPMVGCVLAKGSRIISEGYHRRFGGSHAEVRAIRACSRSTRGATVYVTLEPCARHSKTPPCTDAISEAGIKRVVAAIQDPHPEARGRGFRQLIKAGINVRVGCLRDEARRLNAPFWTLVEQSRPYVVLKWAQDIAGRLTPPPGQPRAISGPAAHRWVHRLRARVDGILVGIETALSDDPQLTARGVPIRRVAMRIVLDSRLRLKPTARLVRTARTAPTLVVTTHSAARKRRAQAARLRRAGVRIEACRARNNRVDLVDALNRLGALRMTNLLVEGGAAVINEFLKLGLADEAFVFVAPRLLDGGVGGIQFARTGASTPMTTARRVGSDTLYHIPFREPDQSA